MTSPGSPTTASFPHPEISDDAYRRITLLLRTGLALSLAILLGALAAYLFENPGATSSSATSSNPISPYLNLGGLVHGLATGAPPAYLALGVFALIATPIARVAGGAYYFHRGHERTMVRVSFVVFVLLIVGVFVLGPLIH